MTHIDPDVYNPDKLVGNEANVMFGYNLCAEIIEGAFIDYIETSKREMPDTWGKLLSECAEQVRDHVMYNVRMSRIDVTCSLMENNLELYGEDENGHCKADDILAAQDSD